MKLIAIYVEGTFHVIIYLTWKWFAFIFFYLTFISLWVAVHTFPKTIKDHIYDYKVAKSFYNEKWTDDYENWNL